jgi:hypothetical protein
MPHTISVTDICQGDAKSLILYIRVNENDNHAGGEG